MCMNVSMPPICFKPLPLKAAFVGRTLDQYSAGMLVEACAMRTTQSPMPFTVPPTGKPGEAKNVLSLGVAGVKPQGLILAWNSGP